MRSIGSQAVPGRMTSGSDALYLHNFQNFLNVYPQITGAIDLVVDSASASGGVVQLFGGLAGNNYTGTTYVNAARLALNAAGGIRFRGIWW